MRNRKSIKYLSTLSVFLFSLMISNAQRRDYNCHKLIKDTEYEMAIECVDYHLTIDYGRGQNDTKEYLYAGILYYSIFNDKNSVVNNLDTNAVEKSILYFYTALLSNIVGAPCYKLDYKVNNERTIIIEILNNPNTSYLDKMIKYDIINRYLPTIKRYTLEHKVSEKSKELLDIMLEIKKDNPQD